MQIGNISIKNKVFLAPMAGITDMPFRKLCNEQQCGFVYTEMVSAKGLFYNSAKTGDLLKMDQDEENCGVQIFGSEPEILACIVKKLNSTKASIIDINMGCPTPKITKNREGSALMKEPKLVAQIIKTVTSVSEKPITIKIRKGWDQSSINAVEIAKIAEENGAKAITVHGRTREQFYNGNADWEIIKKVKDSVSIPVIGNGDIFTPQDAKDMLSKTNCDAVMIARGAQGNPWIFSRVVHFLQYNEILPEPTNSDKIQMIFRHIDMLVDYLGENKAVKEMRKHIAWYIKGMKNSSSIKEKIFKTNNKNEMIEILSELL